MTYFWFKAFHIVGIVCWFAGMFYLPRLFVYHAEAFEQPEPARSVLTQQYQVMEARLYGIIMTPAMLLTVAMAIGLVTTEPEIMKQPWMHIKLACVVLLLGYHHVCKHIMKQLAANKSTLTSQQFRWFNEFPTVLFILVVMLAVFKNSFPTDGATWLIAAMVVAMAAAIQLYARKRRLDKEKLAAMAPATVEVVTSEGSV